MHAILKRWAGLIQFLSVSVVLACASDPVGPTVSDGQVRQTGDPAEEVQSAKQYADELRWFLLR